MFLLASPSSSDLVFRSSGLWPASPSPRKWRRSNMRTGVVQGLASVKQFSPLVRRFSSQIFVSRLPFYTTNSELKELFTPFGEVAEARLVMDHQTKRHKGYGFVTFSSKEEAQKAINAMNHRIFGGKLLIVEAVKSPS